jgi:hypothetical protein
MEITANKEIKMSLGDVSRKLTQAKVGLIN